MTKPAELRARAKETTRSIRVYRCLACKAVLNRIGRKAPRCCGEVMVYLGTVDQTVSVKETENADNR